MFERYVSAQEQRPSGWKRAILAVSAAAHVVVITALVVASFWKIDKVTAKYGPVLIGPSVERPAAEPAAVAKLGDPDPGPKHAPTPPKPPNPNDLTQPNDKQDKPDKQDPTPPGGGTGELGDPNGDKNGTTGGCVGTGCVVGGTGLIPGGIIPGLPPTLDKKIDDTKRDEKKPQVIDPRLAEGHRIAGNRNVDMPPDVVQQVAAEGKATVVGDARICLSAAGDPTSVQMLRSTGYPALDARITAEMNGWRYRPYTVEGQAVSICTSVHFQYNIK